MRDLQFDKLRAIEMVIAETFSNSTNKERLLADPQVKDLLKFFKVNFEELIVLSLLVDSGIRQEELSIDGFLEHFGGSLAGVKPINDALHSLISKGYVISTTKNRFSKTLIKQTFQADEKVYEALLSDKEDRLQFKPARNFKELLKHIDNLFDRRSGNAFDAQTLQKLIENEIEKAQKCAEIDWIKSLELSISEKLILLNTAIGYSQKQANTDLEYTIKQIEDNFSKQKELRDSIVNKTSYLTTNDLVMIEEDAFLFDEFVVLTDHSIKMLFDGKLKEKAKKAFETATVLYPENIPLEDLFYNDAELKQIQTIEKVLSHDKYNLIVQQLEENALGKGVTILFNGFSGTGKTATAKRLAKLTNRALFCVDVEKVVDKWIGNSEKNVKKIFDEYYEFCESCEHTPILFFNEDSIFSKRVDVSHSSDRTHNSMQNILLEQIETFKGITIITSNHAEKLDKAFERRFLYRVDFQKPTKETQLMLLKNNFSSLEEHVIHQALEQFTFTGGQIYNIRKKYIMQSVVDETPLETVFLSLCLQETKTKEHAKIGFNQ